MMIVRFCFINPDSFNYQLQEPLVVHLFIGDILAIVEDGIGGDGR